MQWDEVMAAVVDALMADNDLKTILGGRYIGPMEEGPEEWRIPSIRWTVVSDTEGELFNPILVQLDFKAQGREAAVIIEKRCRKVLHSDVRRELGGIEMLTQFEESREIGDPEPSRVHRQLDFRFEPVRKMIVDDE